MRLSSTVLIFGAVVPFVDGFVPSSQNTAFLQTRRNDNNHNVVCLDMAKIGLIFGTSTGNTETVAEMIVEEFGDDVDGPIDIDALEEPVSSLFGKYDAFIVGTPTWNTGADVERSGVAWDEIYYTSMQELDLKGKKVAVFGLGDQVSYAENYADASGELHDVFQDLGCQMLGYTSQEGYEHEESKAIRGDKFCGLLCDMVNQEDLTEERVQNWVAQLKEEGILEGGAAPSAAAAAPAATVGTETSGAGSMDDIIAKLEKENAELRKKLEENSLEENSKLLDQNIAAHDIGFTPHLNPKTGVTMWTSADGRKCYYTSSTGTETKTAEKMSP